MEIVYQTKGTCCREIKLEIDSNNIITSATFEGGCSGNLQGIQQLIIGQDAKNVAKRLEGLKCGDKGTSCPDQISKAINEYLD